MVEDRMSHTRYVWLGFKKVMNLLQSKPDILQRDLPKIVEFVGDQALEAKEIALEALARIEDINARLNNLDTDTDT